MRSTPTSDVQFLTPRVNSGVLDPAEGLAHPERGRRGVHAGRAVPVAPRRRRRLKVDAHDQVLGGEGRGDVRMSGREVDGGDDGI